ncbi:hypothetical protein RQP46_003128 [Phenoliferia psychrophenolica]
MTTHPSPLPDSAPSVHPHPVPLSPAPSSRTLKAFISRSSRSHLRTEHFIPTYLNSYLSLLRTLRTRDPAPLSALDECRLFLDGLPRSLAVQLRQFQRLSSGPEAEGKRHKSVSSRFAAAAGKWSTSAQAFQQLHRGGRQDTKGIKAACFGHDDQGNYQHCRTAFFAIVADLRLAVLSKRIAQLDLQEPGSAIPTSHLPTPPPLIHLHFSSDVIAEDATMAEVPPLLTTSHLSIRPPQTYEHSPALSISPTLASHVLQTHHTFALNRAFQSLDAFDAHHNRVPHPAAEAFLELSKCAVKDVEVPLNNPHDSHDEDTVFMQQ